MKNTSRQIRAADWTSIARCAVERAAVSILFGGIALFSVAAIGRMCSPQCIGGCGLPWPLHNFSISLLDYFTAIVFSVAGFWYSRRRHPFMMWSALLVAVMVAYPLFWVTVDAIGKIHTRPPEIKWSQRQPPTRMTTIYDSVGNDRMPAVVPFNDEQRKYMTELLSAVLRVMEGATDIPSEENEIFGDGESYWGARSPREASRYYTNENFRISGIKLSFVGYDDDYRLLKASLSAVPRNFPNGAYDMGLPPSVFRDFHLIKSVQETRPGESIHRPVVFYFSHKAIPDLILKVEARSDVAGVDAPYPRTFHAIEITRGTRP